MLKHRPRGSGYDPAAGQEPGGEDRGLGGEGVSPSAPRCGTGKRGWSRFAPQRHPCPVGFHPTASPRGAPTSLEGAPGSWRAVTLVTLVTRVQRQRVGGGKPRRDFFFFLNSFSPPYLCSPTQNAWVLTQECFAIPAGLSPAHPQPDPRQPRPTALFHPRPFPAVTTGMSEAHPGGLFKAEFLAERGRQPLPMAWPPPQPSLRKYPAWGCWRGPGGGTWGCKFFPMLPPLVRAIL